MMEARVIADKEDDIINSVNVLRKNYHYVFTTGGIGPTHDDITAETIAKAFKVPLKKNETAIKLLQQGYQRQELNNAQMKMAYVPQGASLIDNPLSGAPGFQMENVFVMAGVPDILKLMFDGIINRLVGGQPMINRTITTNLGESTFAEDIAELQKQYADISVGSYPYLRNMQRGVNLVIRGTDKQQLLKLEAELISKITALGGKILD